jgi:hypothetical protein
MSDESLDFTTMKWHPAAEAWEMLPEKKSKKSVYSLEELAESVRDSGLLHPIKYWQDPTDNKFWKIDGRNREAACRLAGVKPRYTQVRLPGDVNVVEYVKVVNGDRRHLNASQKAMAAAKLVPILAAEVARTEKARKRAGSAPTGEKHGRSAAAQAGAVTGASERNVQDAALIERKDPELAKKVAAGEVTIHQAKREVVRREKEESLRAAAEAVGPPAEGETWAVAAGSSPGALDELESESADLILLDPPYNQGVDYGGGAKADRLADDDYLAFVNSVVESCVALLAPAGALVLVCPDEYADHLGVLLRESGLHRRAWVKWYETFGTNAENNFNRTSRHVFYMRQKPQEVHLQPVRLQPPVGPPGRLQRRPRVRGRQTVGRRVGDPQARGELEGAGAGLPDAVAARTGPAAGGGPDRAGRPRRGPHDGVRHGRRGVRPHGEAVLRRREKQEVRGGGPPAADRRGRFGRQGRQEGRRRQGQAGRGVAGQR